MCIQKRKSMEEEKLRRKLEKYCTRKDKTECWGWSGSIGIDGRPKIGISGSSMGAHRASWLLTYGKIPIGKCILQKCNNKECINPNHLIMASNNKNVAAKFKRAGRSRLSMDIPEKLMDLLKNNAEKYNQTLTKYVGKQLYEAVRKEKLIG
jgi:hypothetical protein